MPQENENPEFQPPHDEWVGEFRVGNGRIRNKHLLHGYTEGHALEDRVQLENGIGGALATEFPIGQPIRIPGKKLNNTREALVIAHDPRAEQVIVHDRGQYRGFSSKKLREINYELPIQQARDLKELRAAVTEFPGLWILRDSSSLHDGALRVDEAVMVLGQIESHPDDAADTPAIFKALPENYGIRAQAEALFEVSRITKPATSPRPKRAIVPKPLRTRHWPRGRTA